MLENQDYRFLVINGTMQSVMDRHHPSRIVFPHQQILLHPLLSLAPQARVLELGLGGGSALRHAVYHYPQLDWQCVEHSSEVISLFWEYFAPPVELQSQHIILQDSVTYIQNLPVQSRFELILCDVYDELQYPLMEACIHHLADDGILMVNWLPHVQPQGEQSADFFRRLSEQHGLTHQLNLVPGFGNQIHRLVKATGQE